MKTLIAIIIDESGSMSTKKADTIGGYNNFLEEQRKLKDDEARFYLIKFNTVVTIVHNNLPLNDVPLMDENTYTPSGGTALYDAIAEGVKLMDKNKKDDERAICVIITDGEENSSRETTKEQIKDLITTYEAKNDWTFVYIGENPDRWARETNMSARNAIAYCHKKGRKNLELASEACYKIRSTKAMSSKDVFK
ncbi:hypothetical protein B4U79_17160 [Dinothrombium tinctorium]|uniref:VWFA domain-containing protein n=1 Tax=Dinothrombium tinctorium TaxID=1965070 RepID=A0A3S3NTT1_9ACAR|nr:hypothetical protein B4U79_17160 [Dinothrombium tinctorium]